MCLELSVVIPIHNEIDNLAPLLSEIRVALDGRAEYEVLCVDDGSDDGTAERLAGLQAVFPRLRVLRLGRRAGQSAAIVAGVRAARRAWIATLDGDGQDNPADLPGMLPMICAPVTALALVVGHRLRRRDVLAKRVASR